MIARGLALQDNRPTKDAMIAWVELWVESGERRGPFMCLKVDEAG